jgi:hypothetical protein
MYLWPPTYPEPPDKADIDERSESYNGGLGRRGFRQFI